MQSVRLTKLILALVFMLGLCLPAPAVLGEDALLSGTLYAEIQVKDYGTIQLELYADLAPATVTNFSRLPTVAFTTVSPFTGSFQAS